MSCKKCEQFQDSQNTSYYRWKNANIEIRGCDEHLKEIFEILNHAQDEERKKQAGLGPEENPEEEIEEEVKDETGITDDPEDIEADYHPRPEEEN
jgi:hypothetical protein